MSDYYYDPALSRNIMVDIRYVLFIMDTKVSNFLRIAHELGYSVVLEKEGKRIHLGQKEKIPAN